MSKITGFSQSTSRKPPSYRLHKPSGKAIVTLTDPGGDRRDVYLGKHGTAASRSEYARVIAEWEAAGRKLERQAAGPGCGLSVNELIERFVDYAKRYYVDHDGKPGLSHHNRNVRYLSTIEMSAFGSFRRCGLIDQCRQG